MAKIKVGINGLGRIGRTVLREWYSRRPAEYDIVAINNPGDLSSYVHLLKYDSLHGRFPADVSLDGDVLKVGDQTIKCYGQKDPSETPWGNEGVEIVIDATGVFKDKEGLSRHLHDSVKKVIMCAPGKNLDGTFVMGINDSEYDNNKHNVVSNASCTTNCLAPVAKVLNDKFGIINGFMTTIHAYTSDQKILDGAHSDPRRARAAAMSMIPTTTGAAKAVGLVIPELKGKLDGYAVRVPTPDVSFVDLTVNLKTTPSVEEVKAALKDASQTYLKGVLGYTEEPLVSIDFMGCRESSIVDASLTNKIENSYKVVSWYDNEVGFSNRVIDLASLIAKGL